MSSCRRRGSADAERDLPLNPYIDTSAGPHTLPAVAMRALKLAIAVAGEWQASVLAACERVAARELLPLAEPLKYHRTARTDLTTVSEIARRGRLSTRPTAAGTLAANARTQLSQLRILCPCPFSSLLPAPAAVLAAAVAPLGAAAASPSNADLGPLCARLAGSLNLDPSLVAGFVASIPEPPGAGFCDW